MRNKNILENSDSEKTVNKYESHSIVTGYNNEYEFYDNFYFNDNNWLPDIHKGQWVFSIIYLVVAIIIYTISFYIFNDIILVNIIYSFYMILVMGIYTTMGFEFNIVYIKHLFLIKKQLKSGVFYGFFILLGFVFGSLLYHYDIRLIYLKIPFTYFLIKNNRMRDMFYIIYFILIFFYYCLFIPFLETKFFYIFCYNLINKKSYTLLEIDNLTNKPIYYKEDKSFHFSILILIFYLIINIIPIYFCYSDDLFDYSLSIIILLGLSTILHLLVYIVFMNSGIIACTIIKCFINFGILYIIMNLILTSFMFDRYKKSVFIDNNFLIFLIEVFIKSIN